MPVLSHRLLSALLVISCGALLATPVLPAQAGGNAGGAIVKCVDGEGRVTVTDRDCDDGVATVLVAATDSVAPATPVATQGASGTSVGQRASMPHPAATMAPQTQRWSAPRARTAMLAGDAATLRAARSSLQALDEASAAARHQRLAGLN